MASVIVGDFEWSDAKARTNLTKHGVSFEEAVTVLADPDAISAPDIVDPDRWIVIGCSAILRILFVVQTEQHKTGRTRILSTRKASPAQRRKYEET